MQLALTEQHFPLLPRSPIPGWLLSLLLLAGCNPASPPGAAVPPPVAIQANAPSTEEGAEATESAAVLAVATTPRGYWTLQLSAGITLQSATEAQWHGAIELLGYSAGCHGTPIGGRWQRTDSANQDEMEAEVTAATAARVCLPATQPAGPATAWLLVPVTSQPVTLPQPTTNEPQWQARGRALVVDTGWARYVVFAGAAGGTLCLDEDCTEASPQGAVAAQVSVLPTYLPPTRSSYVLPLVMGQPRQEVLLGLELPVQAGPPLPAPPTAPATAPEPGVPNPR